MHIKTSRFGSIEIAQQDILQFPLGLIGMEDNCHWVLLADAGNEALGWLQSVDRSDLAMAVVSPRRFVPDYKIRISSGDLNPLNLSSMEQLFLLAIVGKNERSLTLNLKAPLAINLSHNLGAQVIAKDDHPLQYELESRQVDLRRSA